MIRVELGVEDLANMRFGISPLAETVRSLRALSDPAQHTLHLPWVRAVGQRLRPEDRELLEALIGPSRVPADYRGIPSRAIGDFLTPLPTRFVDRFERELERMRATPPAIARRDLLESHAPDRVPGPLRAVERRDHASTRKLLAAICDAVARYWQLAIAPVWPQMQLVLEADTTYRARQLATGGARRLFADIHPNIRWADGQLQISEMVSEHTITAAGRGMLLMPSIFAPKPVPPLDPSEPPSLAYPSRGIGTLWAPPPQPDVAALIDLLGRTRTLLLEMLDEPMATVEIARRLKITPSAVSQHLRVLHATGLLARARDRRQVLYRRSALGDELTASARGQDRRESSDRVLRGRTA
jgi:DNA-binding transcriptional ArsR family regulator